jgi:uncharacterized membrane protein YkvI
MKRLAQVLQIAATYVGTIVGAGFATGQEILQFFTRYGWMAVLTIGCSTALFIWVGTKLMTLAAELNAKSYEDLNNHLFGEKIGRLFGLFTLIILFGITTVMLAGAGSVFEEHLGIPYQLGLLITLTLAFILLSRGLTAIVAVNSFVVPFMILCSALAVVSAADSPGAGNWLSLSSDVPLIKIWTAPLLYSAFNLVTAQAVLVPLGAAIKDRKLLTWGGILGGAVIGCMLLAGHFALSANMPGITRFEIPMGHLMVEYGRLIQLVFVFVIFGEIFTTFIADAYGLALQLRERTGWPMQTILAGVLVSTYLISQIGFSNLLSTLYPLFGMVSMVWFVMMLWRDRMLSATHM